MRRPARDRLGSGGAPMLHITNGDATRMPLERSGVPGTFVSWDDLLAEGPAPLALGEEWGRVRARYLASAGYGDEDEMLRDFRAKGDPLEEIAAHDEVVFWSSTICTVSCCSSITCGGSRSIVSPRGCRS